MKRRMTFAATLMLFLSTALFAACSSSPTPSSVDLSNSKDVGTWKATTMSLKDTSEAVDAEWILKLNGDGTGTLDDGENSSKLGWEPTDNSFKTRGDAKMTFVDDGANIKTNIMGVDLTFEKQ